MPGVVALPRQVISTALSLTGKAVAGAATSSYVKDLVSSFADKVRAGKASGLVRSAFLRSHISVLLGHRERIASQG
jgi:hypothetical protein